MIRSRPFCPVVERPLLQGRWWAAYAVHETEQKNWEQVQAIFAKALLSCAHVDLWKAYLQYIKASKVETADKVDADAMKEAK